MAKFKNYLSLIKFSHTIFAMPFALIGFFLAVTPFWPWYFGNPDNRYEWFYFFDEKTQKIFFNYYPADRQELLLRLLLVVLCMIFARSAAMAFNRYLDNRIDAKNPRTAGREIPSGVISPVNALVFTIVSCWLFVITCYFINSVCLLLSPIALAVVLGYSYTKRFTPFCHLVLGLGLSLAPIGAYLAVTGMFHWLPALFSLAVICWVSGFDIIYALQDVEFDRSQRLYSIPAWLGKSRALRVSLVLHAVSVLSIIAAGIFGSFGWLYWMGSAVFTGMLIYQHSIVKPDDLEKVNLAFMTANGIASVVFAVFVILDLFIR
jgi:4-hydroxybenzoate polyprenyltransferase